MLKKITALLSPTARRAKAKRKLEKELQAQGYSRSHAQSIVAERFRYQQSTSKIR